MRARLAHEVALVSIVVFDPIGELLSVEAVVGTAESRDVEDRALDFLRRDDQTLMLRLDGEHRSLDDHVRRHLIDRGAHGARIEVVAEGLLQLLLALDARLLEFASTEAVGADRDPVPRGTTAFDRSTDPHIQDEYTTDSDDDGRREPAPSAPEKTEHLDLGWLMGGVWRARPEPPPSTVPAR